MTKAKTQYSCNECGGLSPKWVGKCPDCGAWNTLSEIALVKSASPWQGYAGSRSGALISLPDISTTVCERFSTGLPELDQVLGGGVVAGSVILIGGDPGIGKSTLLLQALAHVSSLSQALYVTGEESLQQVSLRAKRLKVGNAPLGLLAETQVETIIQVANQAKPQIMVIDSVQTIFTQALQSAPGSVSQVRESAAHLVRFAKQSGISLYLVGHVNKEGAIAGPRVLEHMVDTVLYFEGEKDSRFRMVRAIKNRFGAVNELGIFAMTDTGLRGVSNPSAIFLSRNRFPAPGTIVMVTWEGSRPLLIEIQALVDDSHGIPRRVTVGYDHNRLALLLAVLNRHASITLHQMDVFLNVVGGVKITETGADLAILMAVLSSYKNKIIDNTTVFFGEIGLGGELRPVPGGQERVLEAAKHGFKRIIVPKANAPRTKQEEITVIAVNSLNEAINAVLI
ncbi:MAG: DNA repair protein RadA [Proteobacteria bacterium]|nr:DNA repair protein RadA [Pseudomonadota bacterium]